MKLSLKPHKAAAQQNCEAWWYDLPGSIAIYIYTKETGPTVTCSIRRSALVAYLRRSEKTRRER